MTEFEKFAADHFRHKHCMGCGGCFLERSQQVMEQHPIWCIGCRDKIIKATPAGHPLPWEPGGFVRA